MEQKFKQAIYILLGFCAGIYAGYAWWMVHYWELIKPLVMPS